MCSSFILRMVDRFFCERWHGCLCCVFQSTSMCHLRSVSRMTQPYLQNWLCVAHDMGSFCCRLILRKGQIEMIGSSRTSWKRWEPMWRRYDSNIYVEKRTCLSWREVAEQSNVCFKLEIYDQAGWQLLEDIYVNAAWGDEEEWGSTIVFLYARVQGGAKNLHWWLQGTLLSRTRWSSSLWQRQMWDTGVELQLNNIFDLRCKLSCPNPLTIILV